MMYLPTKGRPQNIARFVSAYKRTGSTLPVVLVINDDDVVNYESVKLPDNFRIETVTPPVYMGEIHNIMFTRYPNEPFYGLLADDIVPETLHWDVMLRDACMPDKIAWGFDGIQNDRLPTHPFLGGEFVRKLGYICPHGIKSWFGDNIWKAFADTLRIGRYLPNVRTRHYHFAVGLAEEDATYKSQANHEEDQRVCNNYMQNEFADACRRILGQA